MGQPYSKKRQLPTHRLDIDAVAVYFIGKDIVYYSKRDHTF